VDERTPEQLLNIIEAKGKEITAALAVLWDGWRCHTMITSRYG